MKRQHYHKKAKGTVMNQHHGPHRKRSNRKNHMYSSAATDEIFQRNPPFFKPSHFKLKGWTDTLQGYLNEAQKLTTCIINNRKAGRSYPWFLTVNIWQVLEPKEIAALWTKVCRNLRQHGIVALWVREVAFTNRVHYHLLISNDISKEQLVNIVEKSMPSRKEVGWHKMIEQCDRRLDLLYYITKAKWKSEVKKRVNGKVVKVVIADTYASKRLLFKSGLNLKKYGTIGNFWVRPKKQLWKEVQEREKRIGEGRTDERVSRLAKHAFEFTQKQVPLNDIERSLAYFVKSPGVQAWMGQRLSDETDENAS